MFYIIGVIMAILGLVWLLNGAVTAGIVTIVAGLFVAGYIGSRGRDRL